MERQRSFYNADKAEQLLQPTRFPSSVNRHEVYCGECGETFFLDQVRHEAYLRQYELTQENPFVCQRCDFENDESSYSG